MAGPVGPILGPFFHPEQGPNKSELRFSTILQKIAIRFSWNLFLKAHWNYFRSVYYMGLKAQSL